MSILYLLVTLSKFTLLRSAPVPAQWRNGPVVPLAVRKKSEHQCKIQLEFPKMCTFPELITPHIISHQWFLSSNTNALPLLDLDSLLNVAICPLV